MKKTQYYKGGVSSKLTASLLVFLFILTPIAPVLAQETTTTIIYPSKYYNEDSNGKIEKHIFANDAEVGTVTGSGSEAMPRYTHTDQLSGSNVITNSSGTIDETLDYYPFGGIRIDSGSYSDQRKYAGSEFDKNTGLNYMNARFYDSTTGRFTSQDPVFLIIGNEQKIKQKTKLTFEKYLSDPQGMNSYSYTRNNPLRLIDESGEWFKEALNGQQSLSDFQIEVGQATQRLTRDNKAWNYAVSNPIKGGAVVGLAGGTTALTAVPAVAAFSSAIVNVSGIGPVLVTNRLIEGSIYTYLANDSLRNLPKNLISASEIKSGGLKSYGKFIGGYTLDYAPNFVGETVDAATGVAQFTKSVINKITNLVQKQKKNDNKKNR